jgi:hypothetical protein
VFTIPMAWFERGELVLYFVYSLSYFHRIAFLSYLPNLSIVSPVILACICESCLEVGK